MLIGLLGKESAALLISKIMVATSLGYRTFKDNQIVDKQVMEAALSEDPGTALNILIGEYDSLIEDELQRSRELRGQ